MTVACMGMPPNVTSGLARRLWNRAGCCSAPAFEAMIVTRLVMWIRRGGWGIETKGCFYPATLSWLMVTDGSLACRQLLVVALGFLLGLDFEVGGRGRDEGGWAWALAVAGRRFRFRANVRSRCPGNVGDPGRPWEVLGLDRLFRRYG